MNRPPEPRAVLLLGTHTNTRRHVAQAIGDVVPSTCSLTVRSGPDRGPGNGPTGGPAPFLARSAPFHVIEVEDGSDPVSLAEALMQHRAVPDLSSVVAVVDAGLLISDLLGGETAYSAGLSSSGDDPRTLADILIRQIDLADRVIVVGTGSNQEQALMCRALITHLNPQARVLSDPTREDIAELFRKRFDMASAANRVFPAFPPPAPSGPTATDDTVTTAVWHRSRPVHPARLFDALDEMTATHIRSRGRLWLADHPDRMIVWDAVGSSVSVGLGGAWTVALPSEIRHLEGQFPGSPDTLPWLPGTDDRCQHIAFTGLGADTASLFRLLDSCLLEENELRTGADGVRPPENPFLPLFTDPDHPDP